MTDKFGCRTTGVRTTNAHTHKHASVRSHSKCKTMVILKGVQKTIFLLRSVLMCVCVCVWRFPFALVSVVFFCTCSFNCSNMMQLNSFVITENILFFIMSFVPLHPFPSIIWTGISCQVEECARGRTVCRVHQWQFD